jgi:hypothetical protein
MGILFETPEEKKKREEEFARKHPILAILSAPSKKDNKKKSDIEKRMDTLDLFEDERRAVREEGYEPEDFEDDERDPDDYYNDEY